jgi:citrate synthase
MANESPVTGRAKAGLEDVVATQSAICFIDGMEGRLIYRGYDIKDLAANSNFAETAYLLWYGQLPTKEQYDPFIEDIRGSVALPEEVLGIIRLLPKNASPMEVLRTAVSSLGHYDPDTGDTSFEACVRKAIRLTSRLPLIITAHERIKNGGEPVQPIPGESIAYNFLYTLKNEKPDPFCVKALDVALILHAEHGLNASTFSGRVTASTMSDMFSAVTSAIGTLKGPLHGGANEQVMRMLMEIETPERAESFVLDKRSRKEKIMGFGHRVYRVEEPRATILREFSKNIGEKTGVKKWYEISEQVEKTVLGSTKVFPNVDFYSASAYQGIGIPTELFTPIFAMSRVVGWTAHIMEQWSNNRLIRPRAEYTGELPREYTKLEER